MKFVSFKQLRHMRHHRQLYILAISAIALLGMGVSCDDSKTPLPSACETNPENCQTIFEAKDFFLFKQGSWWVYEEETSHERDSLYVTQYANSTTYGFDCQIKSSLTEYLYNYWPECYDINGLCNSTALTNKKLIYVKESKGKPGEFVAESTCFFVAYKEGDFAGAFNVNLPNNKIFVHDILPDYSLNGFNFNKTVVIRELAKAQEHDQETKHYYSQGIGLVRKELIDSNEVWNLVNYHIQE